MEPLNEFSLLWCEFATCPKPPPSIFLLPLPLCVNVQPKSSVCFCSLLVWWLMIHTIKNIYTTTFMTSSIGGNILEKNQIFFCYTKISMWLYILRHLVKELVNLSQYISPNRHLKISKSPYNRKKNCLVI